MYNNSVEARDTESLAVIAGNVDAMRMQALLVRERILGAAHSETIWGLYRWYHDMGENQLVAAKYIIQLCSATSDGEIKFHIIRTPEESLRNVSLRFLSRSRRVVLEHLRRRRR